MGKGEDESAEQKADDGTKKDPTPSNEPIQKSEDNTKKNTDELRKVIKVGSPEEKSPKKQNESAPNAPEDTSRESMEQRRAILQSIKDFDFQIKKNSEEITSINKKLDSVTKDLDDLVSLYEIVSEQMNPFVGLSKVTKKRIEALETFTKDIEDLRNRMNDYEAFAENAGANLQSLREEAQKMEGKATKDTTTGGLSNEDLEIIIEKSLSEMSFDEKIDGTIDEFIESLKEQKVN